MADITRRGTNQPIDAGRFSIFSHVDTQQTLTVAKQMFCQLLGKMGFATTRVAHK